MGKLGNLSSQESIEKGGMFLNWAVRKKIAIGAARGLAFLHHNCIPHIIHRDMKSSNVLLDEDFEALVSDFGMARLVSALDTHLSVSILAGTPGYVPPEYYQSFRCTAKEDVYSYGRSYFLSFSLVRNQSIQRSLEKKITSLVGQNSSIERKKRSVEILDPELVTEKSGDTELFLYLNIASQCLDDRPFKRPTMVQVMAVFKELKDDTEEDESVDEYSLRWLKNHEIRSLESDKERFGNALLLLPNFGVTVHNR